MSSPRLKPPWCFLFRRACRGCSSASSLGRALKAGDAEATLRSFNTAMDMEVPLRPNLLSGVLNQCAKAGLMDDCMRVVVEMKRE